MNKKSLVFMYIEENYGFFRQEFNFSTKVRFHVYEETKEQLHLMKMPNEKALTDNFWGNNISEINLLVGENGSGKTTIMRIICQWICSLSKNVFPQGRGILVFQKEDTLGYVAFSKERELNIFSDIPKIDLSDFFDDLKVIYFSNTMTEINLNDFETLLDYSMSNRLKKANIYGGEIGNPLAGYKQYEFTRQVDWVLNSKKRVSANYIQMEINNLGLKKISQILPENCKDAVNDLGELWKRYFDTNKKESGEEERELIIELLQTFLCDMIVKAIRLDQKIGYGEKYNVFLETFQNIIKDEMISGNINDIEKACRWVHRFLKDLIHGCRINCEKNEYNIEDNEKWIAYQDSIDDYFSMIFKYSAFFAKWRIISKHKNGTTSIRQIELQGNRENFKEFWNAYKKVSFCIDSIYFGWNLSSGEENRLNLFSILSETSPKDVNFWLLLDEPDNSFHADWSKRLIKEITEFCTEYESKRFQIWISTHSPLLLSDIPDSSAIYLKNDELQKRKKVVLPNNGTFGQNIYVLYNDAFFLKDGVIGEFASEKINEFVWELKLIEEEILNTRSTYNSLNKRIEKCETISAIVGEPVFKQQMEYYLRNCRRLLEKMRERENG